MTIHTGPTDNPSKSEIVKYSLNPNECNFPDIVFCPNNTYIPLVPEFCYLGTVICHSLKDRIKKAGSAYGALRNPIFNNHHITINSRARVYCAIVIPTLLYGSENWCITAEDERKIETFHHNCIRRITRITRLQQQTRHITISTLRDRTNIPSIRSLLTRYFLRWAGHISRMSWNRLQRKLLSSWINKGRTNGSPGMTYGRALNKHLQRAGINPVNWHRQASDRGAWRKTIRDINC